MLEHILSVLRPHADWLFGSGGAAAFILAILKLKTQKNTKQPSTKKETHTELSDQTTDHLNSNVMTRTHYGPVNIGLLTAVSICLLGGLLFFSGQSEKTIRVEGGGTATMGNNNTTIITNN